jgi:LytS/YehU family sensor histidine kinase
MIEENASEKSKESILRLSEIMRFLVENVEKDQIPILESVNFLESYLKFEQERFGERCNLIFRKDIRDESKSIAHYVIFPIIENAFKYGSNKIEPFTINIEISLVDNLFFMSVKNEITLPDNVKSGTGKGLATLEKCLENIYPGRFRLEINKSLDEYHVILEIQL